jgi:cell division protein FtsB
LKQVVSLSWAKTNYHQLSEAPVRSLALLKAIRLPVWVWLVMVFIAMIALALANIARSQSELREARSSVAATQQQWQQVQTVNAGLKSDLQGLKHNARQIESAAQKRLNYLRANEIVVGLQNR